MGLLLCPLEANAVWDLLPQYVDSALISLAFLIWLFYGSSPVLHILVTLS